MNSYNLKNPSTPPPIPSGSVSPSSSPRSGKGRERMRTILFGISLLICFIFAGIGRAYWADTLVAWWWPVLIALVCSLPLIPFGIRLWKVISGYTQQWVNILLHIAGATAIFYFLILFINFKGANFSRGKYVEVTVEKKYTKEHTRSGRRGRRDTKYNTWHYMISFPDGRTKEVQVSLDRYNRIRTGSKLEVETAKGLLGMDVFKIS